MAKNAIGAPRRENSFRITLLTGVFLATSVLGACSSVPDAINPVEWYKGTVDLLVPGEQVAVVDFHGRPAVASGASFAAPRVTALAARLLALNPDWRASDLKAEIISRARLIDGVGRLTSRYGFLDLEALRR